jgi:hypothetical protein
VKKLIAGVVLFAALVAACPAAGPVVAPVGNLAVCVAKDALAGKSIVDIVVDCASTLEEVIAALLSATDTPTLASKAHAEAVHLKATLAK